MSPLGVVCGFYNPAGAAIGLWVNEGCSWDGLWFVLEGLSNCKWLSWLLPEAILWVSVDGLKWGGMASGKVCGPSPLRSMLSSSF